MKKFFKFTFIALVYLFVFLLIQGIVSAIATSVMIAPLVVAGNAPTNAEAVMDLIAPYIALITLISNILTVFFLWIFFLCRKKKLSWETGLVKTSRKNIIASVLFGLGISFTIDLVMNLMPIPESAMTEFIQQNDQLVSGNPLVGFLSICLFAPISEEIIFRGLIYTRLKRGMHVLIAGAVSALLFGLVHGQSVWIFFAFLAGVALVWIYEITGSLWCSFLVHLVNNTISYSFNYLPDPTGLVYYLITAVCVVIFVLSALYIYKENPKQITGSEY